MYNWNKSLSLKNKTVLIYILLAGSLLMYSEAGRSQVAESGAKADANNPRKSSESSPDGQNSLQQISAKDTKSTLVAHWSFDEYSGDVIKDYSGKAASGTLYGATRCLGIKNGALSFDGKDDYAQVPDNNSMPPPFLSSLGKGSISLWFNVNRIPTDFGIMPILYYGSRDSCANMRDGANQGLVVELGHSPISKSKSLYFTIWANGCDFPSFCFDSRQPVSEKEWHHFVAVVGEDYNTGYLDGEEITNRRYNFGNKEYSQFFENAVSHETLWIGRGYWNATPMYFDGMIDDIRIYSKPLDPEEIRELYNSR